MMLQGKKSHKFLISIMALAVTGFFSNTAFAQTVEAVSITITGNVSVNGQPAKSNSTIVTNSEIVSSVDSGAVISFGENGSIELFNDTSINLKFTKNSIVVMLSAGKIQVKNSTGISAIVITRTATIVADTNKVNSFVVNLCSSNKANCQEPFVETSIGSATMTTFNNRTPIPAGSSASIPTQCLPCLRPGGGPPTTPIATGGLGIFRFFSNLFGGSSSDKKKEEKKKKNKDKQ